MFERSGDKVLEKALPRAADHTRPMRFELWVERGFDPYPDPRDLRIIVPFERRDRGSATPQVRTNEWDRLVDGMGFEPTTPALRTPCSPS